jgi:hypothetical protein
MNMKESDNRVQGRLTPRQRGMLMVLFARKDKVGWGNQDRGI